MKSSQNHRKESSGDNKNSVNPRVEKYLLRLTIWSEKFDDGAKEFFKIVEQYRAGSFILTIIVFVVLLVICIVVLGLTFLWVVDPNPAIASISTFALAFFGLLAMIGATLHLFEVQRQNQMANEIQKASFLLDLDNRFIQPQMLEAQQELSSLWERADNNLKAPKLTETELHIKSKLGKEIENRRQEAKEKFENQQKAKQKVDIAQREFDEAKSSFRNRQEYEKKVEDSEKDFKEKNNIYHNAFCNYLTVAMAHDLDHLRKSDPDLYHVLLRNCEIFETMGLLRDRGYLNFADVSTRFRYAIHRVYVSFYGHIQLRGKDVYSQKIFYYVLDLGKWHESKLLEDKLPAWTEPKSLE